MDDICGTDAEGSAPEGIGADENAPEAMGADDDASTGNSDDGAAAPAEDPGNDANNDPDGMGARASIVFSVSLV